MVARGQEENMNKRKFLAILLSVIMVSALAVPTLTAFAETNDPIYVISNGVYEGSFGGKGTNEIITLETTGDKVWRAQGSYSGNRLLLTNSIDASKIEEPCISITYSTAKCEWPEVRIFNAIGLYGNQLWIKYNLTFVTDGSIQTIKIPFSSFTLSDKDIWGGTDVKGPFDQSVISGVGFNFSGAIDIFEIKFTSMIENNKTKTITFYDGNKNKIETLSTAYSTVDGVLPDYTAVGKVFIGWQSADGKLYAAGAAVTAETPAELYAAAIEFATQDGAYIRVGENADMSGIRFDTTFNAAEYTAIKNFVTEYGTLILPKDFLTEGKDFTLENFEVDKTILKIKSTVSTTGEDGVTTYRGAIFEINEANYNRYFAARGYFTVKYTNGETKNFYSAAYANNSIANVAKEFIKTAGYQGLSDEQKSIVDAYAAKYQA